MAIEHTIEWSADGYNGLIDWLGENKVGDAFANPDTTRGFIDATQITNQSGTLVAAKALDQATGTTSNRSHTTNPHGAWWQLDFGVGNAIGVRRIGIIGQSATSNQPRYFVVLGANSDGVWHELASAENVGPTNAAWWSVAVTDDSPYRYIRILGSRSPMDSSSNNFLVLGDVEIWGDYHDSAAPEAESTTFVAEGGRGWRGLFEWLGQNKQMGAWSHPETSRSLCVTSMSVVQAPYTSHGCIDHNFSEDSTAHSTNAAGSWWKVDLGAGNLFKLVTLALYGRSAYNPRNFRVEGSFDDSAWVELYDVPDGSTGPTSATWSTHAMDVATTSYRYFRITQYGANSNPGAFENYLTLNGLEFYGEWNPTGGGAAGSGMMLMGVG